MAFRGGPAAGAAVRDLAQRPIPIFDLRARLEFEPLGDERRAWHRPPQPWSAGAELNRRPAFAVFPAP
jgi:hypothetical protein